MPISLHAAFVPTARQIVAATQGLIDKVEAFCAEKKIAPDVMLGLRVIADMAHLGYQLKSVAVHSAGAIAGTRAGAFAPDWNTYEPSFDAYRAVLADADAVLAATTEAEMEGWIGRDMAFVIGERRMGYLAEDFLLSFSQPNLHFHATTAYDILRAQGVPLGKKDYLGKPRRKD